MLDFLIILVYTTISADGPFSQSRSHNNGTFAPLNINRARFEIAVELSNCEGLV